MNAKEKMQAYLSKLNNMDPKEFNELKERYATFSNATDEAGSKVQCERFSSFTYKKLLKISDAESNILDNYLYDDLIKVTMTTLKGFGFDTFRENKKLEAKITVQNHSKISMSDIKNNYLAEEAA